MNPICLINIQNYKIYKYKRNILVEYKQIQYCIISLTIQINLQFGLIK